MHGNRTITKHRLWASSCHRDNRIAFAILNRNKLTFIVVMVNFDITQGSEATRAPINDALGAIYETSIVKTFKDGEYSL
ncbi:unannotated protein [freshwater metagenome]|uniref:Unannotated protein n=1 Tax=freshwater metagenome TaxID=449393 RepID=A0A6J6PFN9_9ZZZZ